ncbi:MAG: hypothetical protein IPN08_08880 [Bacteroidales bacterium]|nr:hypothetical protein [Bacteroidales bacterium]
MKTGSIILFAAILIMNHPFAEAQKLKISKVSGEFQVKIENNETQNQAKERAEELAKLNAIEKEFGTYVEMQTGMTVEEGKVNYSIMAGTRMKADWIETTKKEFSFTEEKTGKSGEKNIYVKCTIEGTAREIRSKAKIEALSLSCPQKRCFSEAFKTNQQMYLYFKAPVDGYLSIYIDDGVVTQRLLPYEKMINESFIRIKGDKEYVFFENKKNLNSTEILDEVYLTTEKSEEYNNIFVVFSEEPYVKPNLEASKPAGDDTFLPKSLTSDDFQEWLASCRATSPSFQDRKIRIRISKK